MLSEQLIHLLMAMNFGHIQCSCIVLERMTHTIQHCNTPHCRELTLSFRRALAPALSSRLVVATSPSLAAKNREDQPVFCKEREGTCTVYTQVRVILNILRDPLVHSTHAPYLKVTISFPGTCFAILGLLLFFRY